MDVPEATFTFDYDAIIGTMENPNPALGNVLDQHGLRLAASDTDVAKANGRRSKRDSLGPGQDRKRRDPQEHGDAALRAEGHHS
jgi:hypothetical protein